MGVFDELLNLCPQENCYNVLTQKSVNQKRNFMNSFYNGFEKIISDENAKINDDDIDKFVNYMLNKQPDNNQPFYKNNSMITANRFYSNRILTLLTTRCMLTAKQIDNLLEGLIKTESMNNNGYPMLTSKNMYFWIYNLKKMKCVFTHGIFKNLDQAGYDKKYMKFLNEYDSKEKISVKRFMYYMTYSDCNIFLLNKNILGNLVKNISNNNYNFTDDDFFAMCNNIIMKQIDGDNLMVADTLGNYKYKMLLDFFELFEKCGFKITSQHFEKMLFNSEKMSYRINRRRYNDKITFKMYNFDEIGISYLFKYYLNEYKIINYFSERKIYLNFEFVYHSYTNEIFNQYLSIHHNNHYGNLDSMNVVGKGLFEIINNLAKNKLIIKNKQLNQLEKFELIKKIIMLPSIFTYYRYQLDHLYYNPARAEIYKSHANKIDLIKYFDGLDNFENIKNDPSIAKLIVCVNDEHIINLMIDKYPKLLCGFKNGLKYACVNFNENLINFYLNNKFEPTQYDVVCLIKSFYMMPPNMIKQIIKNTDDNTDKKNTEEIKNKNIEIFTNILYKFSSFGLKIDEDVYRLICMINDNNIDHKLFDELFCHLGQNKIAEIKKSVKKVKYLKLKYSKLKKPDQNLKSFKGFRHLLKFGNLQTLLILTSLDSSTDTGDQIFKHNQQACFESLYDNFYSNVFEYFADELQYVPTENSINQSNNALLKECLNLRKKYVVYENDKTNNISTKTNDILSQTNNNSSNVVSIDHVISTKPHELDCSADSDGSVETLKKIKKPKVSKEKPQNFVANNKSNNQESDQANKTNKTDKIVKKISKPKPAKAVKAAKAVKETKVEKINKSDYDVWKSKLYDSEESDSEHSEYSHHANKLDELEIYEEPSFQIPQSKAIKKSKTSKSNDFVDF